MIQLLPPAGLKAILHLLNATTRLEYWPKPLKQAKVIMILKPEKRLKRHNVIQAYQPPPCYL
jgi:hypothetical protein